METGTALLLGAGVGLGIWWLTRPNGTPAQPRVPTTDPGRMYTGNDLGPFRPVLSLPGLRQGYGVLAPINTELQKIISPLSDAARGVTGMAPTTVVNQDGTITRTVPSNWYTNHIGKPASAAGSSVVKTIGDALSGGIGAVGSIF